MIIFDNRNKNNESVRLMCVAGCLYWLDYISFGGVWEVHVLRITYIEVPML